MSSLVWGFPVDNLYKYILQYYKKEREQLRLDYNQRVALLALFKQIKLGAYSPDKDTDTGYFDVIGSDRRKAWIALGSRSKEEAQVEVVQLLEGVCPSLKDAVLKHVEEGGSLGQPSNRNGVCNGDQEELGTVGRDRKDEPDSGTQFLNGTSTTVNSFPPRDPPAPPPSNVSLPQRPTAQHPLKPHPQGSASPTQPPRSQLSPSPKFSRNQGSSSPQMSRPPQTAIPQPHQSALAPATLWCSPNSASQFVSQMRTSPSNVLDLSPGERLSIQVPTSPHATAVVWEFATEQRSIGFGLYFQRQGSKSIEQLIPAAARECSVNLIIGKHQYQEHGVYLLEFINTHSSRPDTVFYRVFYQNNTIQQ